MTAADPNQPLTNSRQAGSANGFRRGMEVTQQRKRPFVLGVFALILSLQAFILPVLVLVLLLAPASSPIDYNGEKIPIGEVRPQMLTTMIVWLAFAAYVGPGLWKGKPVARHIAFGTYVILPLAMMIATQDWSNTPWLIICYAIVGGYLYAKPNVRTWFDSYERG